MATSNDSYELARRRVIAKTIFTWVVAAWVLLALVQVAIWYLTTPDGYFWPVWPILGTLVVVIVVGVITYGRRPAAVSESRIQAEMARMRNNS